MKKWFLLFLFFLLSPVGTSAFSLSPAKVSLTIDPGETQIVEIKIKNNDDVARGFRPVIMGVEQSGQGSPKFVSGASEVESWVTAKTEKLSLLSGQQKNIQFFVDVPMGSYPGSYYLGVGVEQLSEQDGNVNLSGRLLSLVNIKVAGIVNEEIKVNQWQSIKKVWFKPDWKFVSEIVNKGNVELPLSGELIVYNFWGKKIASKELYLGNKLIPGTSRNFSVDFSLPGKHVFIPGIYQTDFVLHYGLTNQKMVLSTKLWYFYLPTMLVLGALIFLLILFYVLRGSFFHKRR